MESHTVKREKRSRNISIVFAYTFQKKTAAKLAVEYGLSESRVSEIIWNFLAHYGYKPILHPGRLSPDLVLRVMDAAKLERLHDDNK
jgi:hypothetical protein